MHICLSDCHPVCSGRYLGFLVSSVSVKQEINVIPGLPIQLCLFVAVYPEEFCFVLFSSN